MNLLRLISLFSGIGAFEKALDKLGIPYELAAYCEIDKYASKSYAAIHGVSEELNLGDITKVDEKRLPKDIDLLTYGFPCQDISIAGAQKGLFNADGTQTRSGLFFEALRIIEETKPRVAIAENVKNLTSKKFAGQFKLVLDSLGAAGYNSYWQVLNAKNFGVPQNRERVFIVSIRKDVDNGTFNFPTGFPLELRLKDVLEDDADERYYISDVALAGFIAHKERNQAKGNGFGFNVKNGEDVAPTIRARYYKDGQECLVSAETHPEPNVLTPKRTEYGKAIRKAYEAGEIKESRHNMTEMVPRTDGISNTLTTVLKDNYVAVPVGEPTVRQIGNCCPTKTRDNPNQGRIYDKEGLSPSLNCMGGGNRQPFVMGSRIRKLTPKECFRLMDFDDEDYEKAATVNSNTQLYKQAGNSIVVAVPKYIIAKLLECGALSI